MSPVSNHWQVGGKEDLTVTISHTTKSWSRQRGAPPALRKRRTPDPDSVVVLNHFGESIAAVMVVNAPAAAGGTQAVSSRPQVLLPGEMQTFNCPADISGTIFRFHKIHTGTKGVTALLEGRLDDEAANTALGEVVVSFRCTVPVHVGIGVASPKGAEVPVAPPGLARQVSAPISQRLADGAKVQLPPTRSRAQRWIEHVNQGNPLHNRSVSGWQGQLVNWMGLRLSTFPLRLIAVRQRCTTGLWWSQSGPAPTGAVAIASHAVEVDGMTGLFSGLDADLVMCGLHFAVTDSLCRLVDSRHSGEAPGQKPSETKRWLARIVSGCVATVAVMPLRVVRDTMALSGGRGSSMFSVLQHVVADGGISGLFRGVLPAVAASAAAHGGYIAGVMIFSFLKKAWRSRRESDEREALTLSDLLWCQIVCQVVADLAIEPLEAASSRRAVGNAADVLGNMWTASPAVVACGVLQVAFSGDVLSLLSPLLSSATAGLTYAAHRIQKAIR